MPETEKLVVELAEKIVETYNRKNTIADVAKKMGISYDDVHKVLEMSNFQHTIQRTSSNSLPGRKYYLVHLAEDFMFLKKYL